MRNSISSQRKFMVIVLFMASMCAIGFAAFKRQQGQTKLPKVTSKVKNLEVVSVSLEQEGDPTPVLAIVVRNNSDKPIVALSVESGDEKDTSGVSTDGFTQEPPSVVLQPYGTITMKMEVSNLLPGKPVRVSGVMYADDTAEGEEAATKMLRSDKERAKGKN